MPMKKKEKKKNGFVGSGEEPMCKSQVMSKT
jgi:hypothetical protein